MSNRIFYQKEIEKRIQKMKAGTAFSAMDFADIAGTDATNKALSRLAENGSIRRVVQGVYDKPEYSSYFGEYTAPNVDGVAKALARKHNWTIAPCGDTALNRLHLSTQVPNVWSYISDGPYKTYTVGNFQLNFKKTANREITGKSGITVTLIQALKALGPKNIDEKTIKILRDELSGYDYDLLLYESRTSTAWVRETIKKILSQEEEHV